VDPVLDAIVPADSTKAYDMKNVIERVSLEPVLFVSFYKKN
jgi:acetyl-CoA carboxylase carboxyltransferase component